MTVNKRLRFEIFKRDGFRCTYCGATPVDSELHADHVVPKALGGQDTPENLTTSCADCNSGKASTSADDAMVAAVNEAVALEQAARERATKRVIAYSNSLHKFEAKVHQLWNFWVPGTVGPDITRISDWHDQKVPINLIEFAFRVSAEANVANSGKAGYAVAIVRNKINENGW